MNIRWPWKKPAAISSSLGKITDSKLRGVIHAGVAARILIVVQETIYAASGQIADPAARQAHAESEAKKAITDFIAAPHFTKQINDETEQFMRWIKGARCHRESFGRAVLTHLSATLTLTALGFIVLVVAGVITRTHPASKVVETAGAATTSIVNNLVPETESEHNDQGHLPEKAAPAKSGSAGSSP